MSRKRKKKRLLRIIRQYKDHPEKIMELHGFKLAQYQIEMFQKIFKSCHPMFFILPHKLGRKEIYAYINTEEENI